MKLKTIASIIALSIITTSMTQASTQNSIVDVEPIANSTADVKTSYHYMSTEELQVEVEKYSNKDCLPFSLGKELIKRWTNG